MAGRNYGTQNHGYYYDEAKKIGYDIRVPGLYFGNVAYHSKKQLVDQLLHDNYKKEDIEVTRNENL